VRAAIHFLIFFGSQTSLFFLTTTPQSVHLYRPCFGLPLGTLFLHPIQVLTTQSVALNSFTS
jgi:hypothetical protein